MRNENMAIRALYKGKMRTFETTRDKNNYIGKHLYASKRGG